jgi:hypothetical protein
MDRMLDKKLVPKADEIFSAETTRLRKILQAIVAPQRKLLVSPLHTAQLGLALGVQTVRLEKKLGSLLLSRTRETQAEALRSMAQFLGAIKVEGTSLDDHATVERLIRSHKKALTDRRTAAVKQLVVDVTTTAQQSLRSVDKTLKAGVVAKDVGELVEGQAWKLARMLRTEESVAFNSMQDLAFNEVQHELPGIMRRWTELVNDLTGAPLDDRVAQDSLLLHGQVAKPGQPFMMPSSPSTPSRMIGGSWMSPPNRPNDRAVLTPWYQGCGVPAWIYLAGERVILK